MTPRARRRLHWAGALAVLAALGAVSLSYLDPHLMLDLADRLWACF
ncbi:MAG: hypothetical protein HZC37_03875 [Burkholderiales bacterium]|nr:hypothetical protein [Burkholderiales bacterium]